MGQEIVTIEQDALYPVVLCDERPSSNAAGAIFIFSRDDGEKEVTKLASVAWRTYMRVSKKIPFVVINGTTREQWKEKGIEFGGTEMWRGLLKQEETPNEYILATGPAYHTGAEADELVHMAREKQWKASTIVAMPYHILRCFLTVIKAMEKAQHYLNIYNLTLPSLFWRKSAPKVLLSGTFEEGTRIDHILSEHARIKDYTEKGFCATRDEALIYLARRGKRK